MRSLIVVAALIAASTTASAQRARSAPKAAVVREPSEAEMQAAVLGVMQFRMQRIGMEVTITYFEKQGCEKADGRIGYNCDFLIRYGGNGMMNMMNTFIGADAANQASGRFYMRNGKWDFLEDRRQN